MWTFLVYCKFFFYPLTSWLKKEIRLEIVCADGNNFPWVCVTVCDKDMGIRGGVTGCTDILWCMLGNLISETLAWVDHMTREPPLLFIHLPLNWILSYQDEFSWASECLCSHGGLMIHTSPHFLCYYLLGCLPPTHTHTFLQWNTACKCPVVRGTSQMFHSLNCNLKWIKKNDSVAL